MTTRMHGIIFYNKSLMSGPVDTTKKLAIDATYGTNKPGDIISLNPLRMMLITLAMENFTTQAEVNGIGIQLCYLFIGIIPDTYTSRSFYTVETGVKKRILN